MNTAQSGTWLRGMVWVLGILFAAIALAAYSCGESLRAFYAAETLPDLGLSAQYPGNEGEVFALQRKIQQHFMQHDVYIPLQDVVVEMPESDERLTFLMRKACGQAKLYIWLPFAVKLPLKGKMLSSWCWKTQLATKTTTQN
jgi:hypothetical protein